MKTRCILFSLIGSTCLLTGATISSGALLGAQPNFPLIAFNNTGVLTNDPGTGLFQIMADPVAIRFSAATAPRLIATPRSMSINVLIDSAGGLSGDFAGDDLFVTGGVDTNGDSVVDLSGVLLTGEVNAFGFEFTGTGTDQYDFRFTLTGGLLAPLMGGGDIVVTVSSERSTFTGDFSVAFGGGAKGTIGSCGLSVTKEGCIIQPAMQGGHCTAGAVAMTLMYTGTNINTATTVVITGSSGASVTYNLPSLSTGDFLTMSTENGFSIDATAHGQSKLGSTTTVTINGVKEVLHTSCSCSANPTCNLVVCNPICLDASSPDNPTGSKGPCSPLWTLMALKDPNAGILTCPAGQRTDCVTMFTTQDCVAVKYTYRVTNNGSSPATDVIVTDDRLGIVPGSPIASIAAGQTVTLVATGTVCCTTTNIVTVEGACSARASAGITKCSPLAPCTVRYPFASTNPRTSVVFNESEVLRAFIVSVTNGCMPDQIRVFYNDEHALTLGIRRINVKTSSGTTATDYPVTPLTTNPGAAINPLVGSTITSGDQAGTDLAGRPIFPSLFVTDITFDPNSLSNDWQFGGIPIPPHAVFGTWKAAVKTVDKTKTPNVVTVVPDADPAKNNYKLGPGSDPVPAGLVNQGWGAEIRWNVSQLGLLPGHIYRLYFMVHDGDQNKSGGDVGHACTTLGVGAQINCVSPPCPACRLGYPFASDNPRTSVTFNENEVLRAFSPAVAQPGDTLKVWYNDEHALTLGIKKVTVKSSSGTTTTFYPVSPLTAVPDSVFNPLVGSTALTGDQAGTDPAGRPIWPALFITDITFDPTSKAGDWQFGGTPIPPNAVFGTWKAASKTVDNTKVPPVVTITTDADPAKNNWNLDGGDPAPAGLKNEGYGAEAVWDVDALINVGLFQMGHAYRVQFMVHDGDQNKVGGDVGQGCATVVIGNGPCPF